LHIIEFKPRTNVLPWTRRLGNLFQSQHRSIKVFGVSFSIRRHSDIHMAELENAKLRGVL